MTSILEYHPDYTDVLECPTCGGGHVDVDGVEVIGGRGQRMRINLADDQIVEILSLPPATPREKGEHHLILTVSCMTCGGFQLRLRHVHGQTFVSGQSR